MVIIISVTSSCLLSPQASRVEVDIALLGSYVMFIEEQCPTDHLQDVVEVSHAPKAANYYTFNP